MRHVTSPSIVEQSSSDGVVGRVVVLADGDLARQHLPVLLDAGSVVAADGGAVLAGLLGLSTDVVVGDLDSLDPRRLDELRREGSAVEGHPTEKDATDLELAIERAAASPAPARIDVVGGGGGRLSHELANLGLVCDPRWRDIELRWWCGGSLVVPVHQGRSRRRSVMVEVGAMVSLLPVGGDATGVATSGLRWRLEHEPLSAHRSRGVSNVAVQPVIEVSVGAGVLAMVIDDAGMVRP